MTLALSRKSFCLPSISILRNRALCPISKSMVGTTGTNKPMSRFKATSKPGKVRTCPRLDVEIPDRTSKDNIEPKSVFAAPFTETLPDGWNH